MLKSIDLAQDLQQPTACAPPVQFALLFNANDELALLLLSAPEQCQRRSHVAGPSTAIDRSGAPGTELTVERAVFPSLTAWIICEIVTVDTVSALRPCLWEFPSPNRKISSTNESISDVQINITS